MLGYAETIDQLAMANSVHWYGQMVMMRNGPSSTRGLMVRVKGQRKKGSQKVHER